MNRNDLQFICSLNQTVMNKDKSSFAQLVSFIDNFKFLRIVNKYDGDKYIKSYIYWNQYLTYICLDNYTRLNKRTLQQI